MEFDILFSISRDKLVLLAMLPVHAEALMPWPFKGPFKDELKFTMIANFLKNKEKR